MLRVMLDLLGSLDERIKELEGHCPACARR
jgi:hypothetical protein